MILKIRSTMSESTVRLECGRDSSRSLSHLRIAFAANIVFRDEEASVDLLALNESPLFGFADDFTRVVSEVVHGASSSSFNDFYDEYSLTVLRLDSTMVRVRDNLSDGFVVELDELVRACLAWHEHIRAQTAECFPELAEHREFCSWLAALGSDLCSAPPH